MNETNKTISMCNKIITLVISDNRSVRYFMHENDCTRPSMQSDVVALGHIVIIKN